MTANLHCNTLKVLTLPEFTPTPFMLEKFKSKGLGDNGEESEPWKVYAWCVREAMSQASGIPTLDDPLDVRLRFAYEKLMNGKVDEIEV